MAALVLGLFWVLERRPQQEAELSVDVLERVKGATVLIERIDPTSGRPASVASGFVIDDGAHILTNRHAVANVIRDAPGTLRFSAPDTCTVVFFSGTPQERQVKIPAEAVVVNADEKQSYTFDDLLKSDLAVIKIPSDVKSALSPPSLTFGDSSSMHETENVWLCGFPLALSGLNGAPPTPSVQKHDIVNLYRNAGSQATMLQLSGSGTHGNSGGPVVSADGRVIGVFDQTVGEGAPITRAIATQYILPFLNRSQQQ